MAALTEITDGIYELRLPIPFEDGLVNVFLFVDGHEVDMLDCGMNSGESLELISGALQSLGGKRLRKLVVTHIHPDHYGAAGVLAGPGRADLYLHRLEVPLVHPRYVDIEQLVAEVHNYLLVNGVPDDEAEVLSNSQRALSQVVAPAEPTVQLDGAETLTLGRTAFRVEWTPGHSPGHICLHSSQRGLLFAGDHVLPDLSPNIGLHPQSTPDPLHDYIEGLTRLARYSSSQVLPAHGRPFTGIAARVEALIKHHQRRMDQVMEIVSNRELTGWQVALELWGPRRQLYEKRLALQEGLAHLQALAVAGDVEKRVTPETVSWRRLSSSKA
ncbi:MAG TPA: MBL fold metallo-hydrolase [Candidatus Dormibacteraeota bacterium]|nr:MBL fold metallo-hydrolase [Candidatus Dormibacteraeota bacterium]